VITPRTSANPRGDQFDRTFTAQAQNQIQVNSEGTQLQFGQVRYRLELSFRAKPLMAWTSTAITI